MWNANSSKTPKVQRQELQQGKMHFNKTLSMCNITEVTKHQQLKAVCAVADSTCTPGHASLAINSCYLVEGAGVAKLSKMKGQFSFSHLHLFSSIVKESLLFYKHLSIFWSF